MDTRLRPGQLFVEEPARNNRYDRTYFVILGPAPKENCVRVDHWPTDFETPEVTIHSGYFRDLRRLA